MDITAIGQSVLDGRTKGIPGTAKPFALADIAAQGWNVLKEDMPLPLMVLKRASMVHNLDLFANYLTENDLCLAPHGKTTMSPQIFKDQLDHGAWGMTAATVSQMQVMRHHGVDRIVLANQLVGKSNLKTVVAELEADPKFQFFCFIDSVALLDHLSQNLAGISLAQPLARPLDVLIEIGAAGGRTGARTKSEALAIFQQIAARPNQFRFCGLGAFEGAIAGLEQSAAPVRVLADLVLEIAESLPAEATKGLDEFILTGGGSAYFDIIAERFKTLRLPVPVRVLLRSGCYVTNDHGAYRGLQEQARRDPDRHWHEKFRPALEVWSYVQSLPEPGLGFLTMGKRDVPYDAGLPVPIKRYRPGAGFLGVGESEIFATNDQHAFVRLGAGANWHIGDMICSGISHPCTAFDKWRFIPVVNDDYDVVDGLLTYF